MGNKVVSNPKDHIYLFKSDTNQLVSFINMTEQEQSKAEQLSPSFNKTDAVRFFVSTTIT